MSSTLNQTKATWFTLRKKIFFFFLLAIAMIAAMVVFYANLNLASKRTSDRVTHTEKILAVSDSMMANEKDMVIGTRSFLLTANKNYLASLPESHQLFRRHFQQLKQLTKDNIRQQERLDSLYGIYQRYRAVRAQTLELRGQAKENRTAINQQLLQVDSLLAKLNTFFVEIQTEEQRLLAERKDAYLKNAHLVTLVIRLLLAVFVLSVLLAFWIVYRNMVNRNKAEKALRKSEELVRGIINYAPILVNVKDKDGRFLLVNRQMADALGTEPEQLIGHTNQQFVAPGYRQALQKEEWEVIKTGRPSELEVKLPREDGLHTYITSKFPLFDEKGELYALGSTSFDITLLKNVHEALENSYQQQQKILNGLQQTLSASSDLLCILNEKGEFVRLSNTATELLGYTPKELMSKKLADFLVETDRPKTEALLQQIMAGETVTGFTNQFRRRDGTPVPLIWSTKWMAEDNLLYGIVRNGTESQNTAYELAQSRARLIYAQKIARLGNWDWDLKNNRWSCSDEIYRLLGVKKEEGKDMQQLLLEAIHPDDRPAFLQAREEAFTRGVKIDREHRIIRADHQVCFVHTKGEVIIDANGNPVWFSGTMQDITQRKEAELQLKQLNENLEKQAAELKASNAELERFAYVASHDLQEPLRMVTSFLGLLQKKHAGQLDESSEKYIHFAVDGAERMKGLIQDLLQYSRLDAGTEKFIPVDGNRLLQDVLHLFAGSMAETGAVVRYEALPVVRGNKTQLVQLFQNLIGNALKYRSEKQPLITVSCREEDDRWLFAVTDNGIGIDPKYFQKIFVIFQRLHNKSEYSGSGIGLAICKKIVENHGGKIWVEANPAGGSTFYFTLTKNNP